MKFFNIALLLVILALACCLSSTFAQDDAGTGLKRPALRRPAGKSVKTTTPPPPPKDEEADYGDENQDQYGDEGEEDGAASSTTTTSTEPPKKVGPVIRPFRSNDDFLNSLKRRQMDAKKNRVFTAEKATPKSKPAPVEDEEDEGAESAPAPAPAKAFKGNPALNRRKLPGKAGKAEPAEDTAEAESEQEPKEDSKARRLPHSRLTLRKRT